MNLFVRAFFVLLVGSFGLVAFAQERSVRFAYQDLETEFWVAGHRAMTQALQEQGTLGSAVLGPHYALTVTTEMGTRHEDVSPKRLPWSTPPAEAIQESVLTIQQHWMDCLREGRGPETSGADNLRTLELVLKAYEVANRGTPYRREAVHE